MKNGIGVTWLGNGKISKSSKSKLETQEHKYNISWYQIVFMKVYDDHIGINTCNLTLRHNGWISDLVVWVEQPEFLFKE